MKAALAVALLLAAGPVLADSALPAPSGLPLPLNLGGPFALIDQHGASRTEADPEGRLQLLFFGYAACDSICTLALPQMAEIAERLAARGIPLRPVLITVDPVRDTPQAMAPVLEALHPEFTGLTGSDATLAAVWRAFSVDRTVVFTDPADGPVYAHGSLLYLLDGQGRFLTLIPPILSDARAADIIAAFAANR